LRIPFAGQIALAVAFGAGGSLAVASMDTDILPRSLSADCNIKGNISINSGERIYHLPGQQYYAETRISPQHGEQWFCSEAEARSAGWRRSRV
jgi:hypothetical protein